MTSPVTGRDSWATARDTTAGTGVDLIDARHAMAASFATTSIGIGAWRGGVMPSGSSPTSPLGMSVQQRSTPSMGVLIYPGQCFIPLAGNAGYVCTLGGTADLTISASSTVNPRIDRVVARQQDVDAALGSLRRFTVEVLTGTPAASPVAPAIPTGCVALARVAVAANATTVTNANVTDERVYVSSVGGIRPVNAASLSDAGSYPGEHRTQGGRLEQWDGAVWASPVGTVTHLGSAEDSQSREGIGTTAYSIPNAFVTFTIARTTRLRLTGSAYVVPQSGGSGYVLEVRIGSTPFRISQTNSATSDHVTSGTRWVDVTAGTYTAQLTIRSVTGSINVSGNTAGSQIIVEAMA